MELHGGNIHRHKRENQAQPLLDYSANINPLGIPASALMAFSEAVNMVTSYPDPEYIELRTAIAAYNNVTPGNIIAGNGASELIFLFFRALKRKRVLIASPTFAEYERAAESAECTLGFFELRESNGFEIDVSELISSISKGYDALVICNPNNPTGNFIPLDKMEIIYKSCLENGVILFVDEAFIEFTNNGLINSIINTSADKSNLFVVRALTKFFAMPGLRLGYAVCFNETLYKMIFEIKEPWSINTFAEQAGICVLKDSEYIRRSNEWINNEKHFFYENLEKIETIKPYKTETNFILVRSFAKTAKEICSAMLNEGILVRDCSNFWYLGDYYFRLAVKERKDNLLVIEKLKNTVCKK